MRHISTFIRTDLRSVPTRTLNGAGGTTKAGDPIEKWDTKGWDGPAKQEVERELGRRKRARNRREKGAAVMHSDAGQNGGGTV